MSNVILPEIPMIVCGLPMVVATAIFNGNAFPQEAKAEAATCANRLSLLLHNASHLRREISQAQSDFLVHLKRNWLGYKHATGSRADVQLTAYWYGAEYTTVFHSVLYEMKAFLDMYARLIVKLMGNGGPPGFSSGKVDGKSVPGGRFYNWLNGLAVDHLPEKAKLLEVIIRATSEWIEPALKYRNTLAHFRDIPGLRHMHVSVSYGPDDIGLADIVQPTLPDEVRLDVYVDKLCENVGRFIESTLPLLPFVDMGLVASWDEAKAISRR